MEILKTTLHLLYIFILRAFPFRVGLFAPNLLAKATRISATIPNAFLLLLLGLTPCLAQHKYDVLMTELLPDPSPQIGLPNGEFVEIYNPTDNNINLEGWTISDPSRSVTITNTIIKPKEHITLCHNNYSTEYSLLGKTVSFSSFPSLNNSGDSIFLKDNHQNIIHLVAYTDDWYNDSEKENGGWSLEMIDTKQPCFGKENWTASTNSIGGTPSNTNSVENTLLNATLSLINTFPLNKKTIELTYNQDINSIYVFPSTTYSINTIFYPTATKATLILNKVLTKNEFTTFKLTTKNCLNLSSNQEFEIGIPDSVTPQDIAINEILFNPSSGGVDFIEIKNISNKLINLNTLHFAKASEMKSYPIDADRIIKPNEIIVFTENKNTIIQYHQPKHPDNIIEIDLPSLPDNEGDVLLIDQHNNQLDAVYYSEDWHFVYLKDKNGVSLEKINATNFLNDEHNWFSASSQVNYSTPTEENSQAYSPNITGEISLVSDAISPDEDGENDQLIIQYQYQQAGILLNAKIFNRSGLLVKQLINNESLNSSGQITWDGQNDTFSKTPLGIYILIWQTTNELGQTTTIKKTFSIGSKL